MSARHRARLVAWFVVLCVSAAPVSSQDGRERGDGNEPWGYVFLFATQRAIPLVLEDNRLGRLPENQVTLSSSQVSRRHASIRRTDDGIEFLDIGSTNGSRLNGEEARARTPLPLRSGDRIQLADDLVLFHETLAGLWEDELRLRLLSTVAKLQLDLPGDFTKRSLGRELDVPLVSMATLNLEEGRVDVAYPEEVDPSSQFPKDTDVFVGGVALDDGVLSLSLWAVDGDGPMTSRRSAFGRLRHTTLRVALHAAPGAAKSVADGPWFPQTYLANVLELHPEDRDRSMRFVTSLAELEGPYALRDAAESSFFRHRLRPDAKLLALAAQSRGGWVDTTCRMKGQSLTATEKEELAAELESARAWLEQARELGARGKPIADAESVMDRAAKRLETLSQP